MNRLALLLAFSLVATGCGGDDDDDDLIDAGGGDIDAGLVNQAQPGKRSDIASVADPATQTIVVFGGDNGPIVDQIPQAAYLDDTWVFQPGLGWSEVSGTGPSARGRHAVALDPNAGRMLLFGGRFRTAGTTGPYTLYDDLWAFDYADQSWSQVDDGAGTAPAPRYFAAAAFDPDTDTFYVWGGGTNSDPLSLVVAQDLWAYQGGSWSQVSQAGAMPSSRLFVAYTYDSSRNRLVVFGGQVGDFVSPGLNDLYGLDLDTGVWTQLHDGSGTAPSGRFSAMITYDDVHDTYLMFGGHADPGVANDLWEFDPTDGSWSLRRDADSFTGGGLGCLGNPREIPKGYVDEDLTAPERRSGGVFAVLAGAAWLFGGESDCSDHLDDTWRFDLPTDDWIEMLEANSGESCARRNVDCTCLCL